MMPLELVLAKDYKFQNEKCGDVELERHEVMSPDFWWRCERKEQGRRMDYKG